MRTIVAALGLLLVACGGAEAPPALYALSTGPGSYDCAPAGLQGLTLEGLGRVDLLAPLGCPTRAVHHAAGVSTVVGECLPGCGAWHIPGQSVPVRYQAVMTETPQGGWHLDWSWQSPQGGRCEGISVESLRGPLNTSMPVIPRPDFRSSAAECLDPGPSS